jgi:methionine synthase II (cobalamin-independent)
MAGEADDVVRPEPGPFGSLRQRPPRGIRAPRLLLEYDDKRSGGFDPLSLMHDELVVLGLVTTKSPRRETEEGLEARIREAADRVGLERLALGTQCGFSTSIVGNALSVDDA